jgi:hypothetical protein
MGRASAGRSDDPALLDRMMNAKTRLIGVRGAGLRVPACSAARAAAAHTSTGATLTHHREADRCECPHVAACAARWMCRH